MKKIIALIFTGLILFACKKTNSAIQYTFPVVSYTLHNNIENQIYDYSHSCIYHVGTTIFDSWWSWDNDANYRGELSCVATNEGTFYLVELFDSAAVVYDPATGRDSRTILSFTFPSLYSFKNYYDSSVSLSIRDTTCSGHATVFVTITGMDSSILATPSPTINGNFNMSGTVSDGYSPDSISFSSSGTFTNMPYNK
jgi:hypothetical protein